MARQKENKGDSKLLSVLSKLDQLYGKGAVMNLNEKPVTEYEIISSGSIELNAALGIGGFPKGRIIEIFGPESSGKTTLAIHAIAEAQQNGDLACMIDAEHAFDQKYAEQIGVDTSKLWLNQPDNGEQALEILSHLVASEEFGIIVVDSVAALVPKAEIDGEMGDSKMGLHARLMSQAMRKLVGVVNKSNTCVIFINQIRDKMNAMGYGPNTTTTGGHALRFAASMRLEVKRIGSDKASDGEVISNRVKVKVAKNKVAPPFKEAEIAIEFGVGIDKYGEILELAVTNKIINKAGSWFSYGDTKLGQGANSVKDLLKDNPELFEEIKEKVISLY